MREWRRLSGLSAVTGIGKGWTCQFRGRKQGRGESLLRTFKGAARVLPSQPLIWLTVAPAMSSSSASHCGYTPRAQCVVSGALSVTQRALSVTQRALSVT
jgi:hypothetical protein